MRAGGGVGLTLSLTLAPHFTRTLTLTRCVPAEASATAEAEAEGHLRKAMRLRPEASRYRRAWAAQRLRASAVYAAGAVPELEP